MVKKRLCRIIAFGLATVLMLPMTTYAVELDTDQPALEQQLAENAVDVAAPEEESTEPAEESQEAAEESTEPLQEDAEPTEETAEPAQEETAEAEAATEAAMLAEETAQMDEAFSCYTYDGQGNLLQGYRSEKDGNWYLFLTSTQSAADTVLYYTGSIQEASAGELDAAEGTVSGAFSASGDEVTLTGTDGSVYSVTVMQSKLPSVYIDLNGTSLRTVHQDKDVKYPGNSVYIMDPSGKYNLTAENSVEFKGRGNSTWSFFIKKGYQIKFDSKTSVLGMGKAKKWVLLANAADETLMRNMLSLDLASQLAMEYVTNFAYIDLWINGEYRGNYIIGEKVEIGSSRLDLQDPYGTLFEHDQSFYYSEDYWFKNEMLNRHFAVKETNVDDSDAAEMQIAIDAFQDSVDELMRYLYTTPPEEVTLAKLETMIDVDSFAKYYLVNEYSGNTESVASSFYWYKDGLDDILHLGPVWDFDCAMGNEKAGNGYYLNTHALFGCLMSSPEFYNRTVSIYNDYRAAFDGLGARAVSYREKIGDSVEMNYIRWDVWGQQNPKDSLCDYSVSYAAGYEKLANWLASRKAVFAPQKAGRALILVDEDGTSLDIIYESDEDYADISFALWSDENGQDDLKWYNPEKNAQGQWEAKVDLSAYKTLGKYTVHVSKVENGVRSRVAAGYAYVDKIACPEISAALSEDGQSLRVVLRNFGSYQDVRFKVWCEKDGTDDLVSYTAELGENGSAVCTVDLIDHKQTGVYRIEAYGTKNGTDARIAATSVDVKTPGWPVIEAEENGAENTLTITVDNAGSYSGVTCHVSNGKHADDYEAVKQENGKWVCTVDLLMHGGNGTYQIAVKGTKNGAAAQIAETNVDVKTASWPTVKTEENRAENTLTITVDNADGFSGVACHIRNGDEEGDYAATSQGDGKWVCTVDLLACGGNGTYQIEVKGTRNGKQLTLDQPEVEVSQVAVAVYRLYNPYTQEHLLTADEAEKDSLVAVGWLLDGVAWSAPVPGNAVYRLYNPYDDWHTYTMSQEEITTLTGLGWQVDGAVFYSAQAENAVPVYRLFNPYEQKNYHLLTASAEEKENLIAMGWTLDGVVLNAFGN